MAFDKTKIAAAVQTALEPTKDMRIDYHVVEQGSVSLLTGIYGKDESRTANFYKTPDITDGTDTKLAKIYGKVMITPYIVDAGVESSTNDPSSILTTYRFIMGDGEQEGIVPGPNGSDLQNVYIIDPNKQPVPVVDQDGRPTVGDVVLASVLGQTVASAPKIWDVIKSAAKNDPSATAPTVDPVTGKVIPTTTEQQNNAVSSRLPLDNLLNVDTTGKGNGYILVWDDTQGLWVTKTVNEALQDALTSSEICGGAGGSGGSGGEGGDGGKGGNGGKGGDGGGSGGDTEPPPDCLPTNSYVSYPCLTAPTTVGEHGMVLLPTIANNANNEYTQQIRALDTKGFDLHLYFDKAGRKAIFDAATMVAECPPDSDPGKFPCLVEPATDYVEAPTQPTTIEYTDPGRITIHCCLTTVICGKEYLFFSGNIFDAEILSSASFSKSFTFFWSSTDLGPLLDKYPGEIFNASNPNIKIYLRRVDECGSEYPVYFEGYKRLIANESNNYTTKAPTSNAISSRPTVMRTEPDDGKYPDDPPNGGTIGPPSCPEELPPVGGGTPGQPGTSGSGGSSGTSGNAGTAGQQGTCGEIDVSQPKPLPKLALHEPSALQYGTQTTPPAFDPVTLKRAAVVLSGIGDKNVSLAYSISSGAATFQLSGPLPAGVTSAGVGTPNFSLFGDDTNVLQATNLVQIKPINDSVGEIHYKMILTNAEGNKAGVTSVLMPKNLVITENKSSCASVQIAASSGVGGSGKINVDVNGVVKSLTDGFVPFTNDINQTAILMASNINGNVAFKNALPTTDPEWLPKFVATAVGPKINICAPEAGGAEFNGTKLSTETQNNFSFDLLNSILTFLGGATKTVNDFLRNLIGPNIWDKMSDTLYSIAGNVAGAVLTNMIMNNSSSVQITIPKGDENATIAFLYKGSKVNVPNEYDGTARTGSPTYDAWGRAWKKVWTDNPAWCLYDYITDKISGLGNEFKFTALQEELLLRDIFSIAIYCDELVNNIDGIAQPRFSLNTVITDGTRLEILEQLCSVFRGGYCFVDGGLRITCDRPDQLIKLLVCQANVEDGNFEYDLSSSKNFLNKIRLTYVEPANFYNEEVVVAELPDALQKWGEKATDVKYFGCTDQSQAIRQANYILLSEKHNAVKVSYNASADHYKLIPGDIVQFDDPNERGQRNSGRIVSQSGVNIVLDAPISAVAGDYFTLTCNDGTIHETLISSITGVNLVMQDAPFVEAGPNSVFIAASFAAGPQLYKVVAKDERSDLKYSISLQLYDVTKFSTV